MAMRSTATQATKPAPAAPDGRAPMGTRLTGNIGPGTLRPGAGKLVQRSGQPLHCGAIAGTVTGFEERPNSRDASRTSTRFQGDFVAFDHEGNLIGTGAETFLPPVIERSLKSRLRMDPHSPVGLAIEIWCEPDPEGRPPSPLGYSYVSYNRAPRAENDPTLRLAVAAGLLPDPGRMLAAPDPHDYELVEETDPETGEIITVRRLKSEAPAGSGSAAGTTAGGSAETRQAASKSA